jgi:glycopeptide antibiotics resistance protein
MSLFVYVGWLLWAAVINRNTFPDERINLRPFWTYEAISEGSKNLIGESILNVVVFLPIGFLLGFVLKKCNWYVVIIFGMMMSVTIEISQLYFRKGLCETDDVIHNTLGCMLGFYVYKLHTIINKRINIIK